MRALVTGAGGQLGLLLQQLAPRTVELLALDHRALDVGDRDAVRVAVAEFRPELIFNAAAYTAVDQAESDAAQASRINSAAPEYLAEAARDAGARLWHFSTDFVFDGRASDPYTPHAPTGPLNVYGVTKLEGEQRAVAAHPQGVSIIRGAWLYAPGGRNFVATMLRLLSTRDQVSVVDDQRGTPSYAGGLARAAWKLALGTETPGVWHWTDGGDASWYEFALAIRDIAAELWPTQSWAAVNPISSRDYPLAAPRPDYSVLDTSMTWERTGPPPHWRDQLVEVMSAEPLQKWG